MERLGGLPSPETRIELLLSKEVLRPTCTHFFGGPILNQRELSAVVYIIAPTESRPILLAILASLVSKYVGGNKFLIGPQPYIINSIVPSTSCNWWLSQTQQKRYD